LKLFENAKVLVAAALDFFDPYNQEPERILSVIGSHAAQLI